MANPKVIIEEPTKTYDHTHAFEEAFDVRDARWFLGKAERELTRYHEATDAEGRLDSLLNFSSSVIALEDWGLPRDVADEAAWRGALRSESAEHAFIVLLALIAKHRSLRDGKFSSLRFETGLIKTWSEEPTPDRVLEDIARATPSARVCGIRTHIDDDAIEGYTVTIEVDGLMKQGKIIPLEQVMSESLRFWHARFV